MIYLDNAATTFPKPKNVYNKVNQCIQNYCANPGRGSHKLSLKCELEIFECRQLLSELLKIPDPLNIIFTKNTTEGLNIAIKGILVKGDHIISTMIEHNSVLRPIHSLSKNGIESTILPVNPLGYIDPDDIKKAIRSKTKAIVINHGSNVLGTVQDICSIGKLAKAYGLYFIVDGAQTVGYLDIDVSRDNIDILAFPGHKSLFGLQGTGGLYIRKGININPLLEGGTGSNSNSIIQPNFLPDSLESGTLNTPGIVGLSQGVKYILDTSLSKIKSHEQDLMKFLTEELIKLPFIKIYGEKDYLVKTPVISFNMDRFDSSEVGLALDNRDIYVRTSYHCAPLIHQIIGTEKKGTVRISPGYFNTFSDIEILIAALKEIYSYN